MDEKEKTSNHDRSWDERYASGQFRALEPHKLLISLLENLLPGTALDLACGAGRHAHLLAENGWQVVAVDNSGAGIEIARRRAAEKNLQIDFRLADLEKGEFVLEENAYDLICDFYYLQRDLYPAMKKAVKPRGIIVSVVHLEGEDEKSRFALREGELKSFFTNFEILHYRETAPESAAPSKNSRRTAEIIARKPDDES